MIRKYSKGRIIFLVFNYVFLIVTAFLCLLPLIHIAAISFSKSSSAAAGLVKLWPVDFTVSSYEFVLKKPEFLRAMGVSLKRILIGGAVNMFLTILIAYPLSKEKRNLNGGHFMYGYL